MGQISKQGLTYVLVRISGEPVWPIEERAVLQSVVPGEQLSAPQLFPTKPAPFEPQGISDETLIDFTPRLREEALQNIEQFDYGPWFTPSSFRGAIPFPCWFGGGEWHDATFDPSSGIYYVPLASGAIVVQLTEADPSKTNLMYRMDGARKINCSRDCPFQTPYGGITTINMNTVDHEGVITHAQGIRQVTISRGLLIRGSLVSIIA